MTSRKCEQEWGTLAEIPFRELVEKDMELKDLRAQYVGLPADQRRKAAQWALDSTQASMLMARVVNDPELVNPAWRDWVAPLAIDPEYAPAMLTVGSLEYQFGRVEEAMALFLKLTTLPADTEDLREVIDKAGNFLIDQGDHAHAAQLYAAAALAYPRVALYHGGLGYCAAEGGRMEESVAHQRRANELEPNNYLHLNDLGYGLLQAGQYDEAEEVLQHAVELAPPDYDLALGNLEYLRKVRSKNP